MKIVFLLQGLSIMWKFLLCSALFTALTSALIIPSNIMLQLHEDPNFHYEAIRAIGTARYNGADISEVLSILPNIRPGNFDD